MELRGVIILFYRKSQPETGGTLTRKTKPFEISKRRVLEAYEKVKANQGAAGVDGKSIAEFETDWKNNLYRIWNRMTSGSYFPPPVRAVEIPKADGKKRKLGIPTVSDRIAQMVVLMEIEPGIEAIFHEDSYGYRPRKSAIEAVGTARKRCWQYDWVIDVDIKGFFDNIDHELMMKAVMKRKVGRWAELYISRWLKADMREPDGTLVRREKGTPQGGVISPLLANLFLHYAFDCWITKHHPEVRFERYADDIVIHCGTKANAERILDAVRERLAECRLELHPEKTKIVYCRDGRRKGKHQETQFDFLGYTFRTRAAQGPDGVFTTFSPAVSKKALKRIRATIRAWAIQRRTRHTIEELAMEINPAVRGWINYYGKYRKSALGNLFWDLNCKLVKWAMRKSRKLRGQWNRSVKWVGRFMKNQPNLFAHWREFPDKSVWMIRAV